MVKHFDDYYQMTCHVQRCLKTSANSIDSVLQRLTSLCGILDSEVADAKNEKSGQIVRVKQCRYNVYKCFMANSQNYRPRGPANTLLRCCAWPKTDSNSATVFIPRHTLVAGYYVFTLAVRVSVRLYVRWPKSVCPHFVSVR